MAELALCRTCARPAARLQPLFTRPERHKRYALALRLATGLQIELNDGLPQHICSECSREVSRVLKFRTNSQKAQTRLVELGYKKNYIHNRASKPASTMKNELVVQDRFFCSDESLDKEDHVEDDFDPFARVENFCSIAKNNIHDHVRKPACAKMKKKLSIEVKNLDSDESLRDDEDDFDSFENFGSIEKNSFSDSERVKLDKGQSHNTLMLDKYLDKSAPLYTCGECKKNYKSKQNFVTHAVIHAGFHYITYMCDRCGKLLSSNMRLLLHQQVLHGAERGAHLRCPRCEYYAIDNHHLMAHMRTHTGERPFICDTCGAGFTHRGLLIQHLGVHVTERNEQCKECPSKFKSRHHLNVHRSRSHKPRRWSYRCTYCPKIYVTSQDCQIHMRKLHGIQNDQQEKPIRVPFTMIATQA